MSGRRRKRTVDVPAVGTLPSAAPDRAIRRAPLDVLGPGASGDPCSDFHAGIEETAITQACDCNSNGLNDVCDLDCNVNVVPDECDPPGDVEADGDKDLADFAQLAVCFTDACAAPPCVPALYADGCCVILDYDLDGDVDLDDAAQFVPSLTGPQ